jgi:hypothetical protein
MAKYGNKQIVCQGRSCVDLCPGQRPKGIEGRSSELFITREADVDYTDTGVF